MPSRRILIVEDEPNIVESLRFILEQAGFVIDIVADGGSALDRLREGDFQAVVLDVMLPGMNGFDVLRSIRADGRTRETPVIVLTAKGQANDRKTAEAIGASAFIPKPFSNAEVVERVRELSGA